MDLRAMPTERLVVVTARLLAAASVLVVVGLALVVRVMWQQTGQSFGPDGTPAESGVDLPSRVLIMVFESGYRPVGVQVVLAAMLVAAAVAVLHLKAAPLRTRWVRLEVLCAGAVVLVAVVGLALSHVYVLTADDATAARANGYIGPQPLTEMVLVNLSLCAASFALLAGVTLWSLRPWQASDDDVEERADEEATSEDAEPTAVTGDAPEDRDDSLGKATVDYSRDWSPEDFRPPR